jgi:cold-inducible RNA-binding protein
MRLFIGNLNKIVEDTHLMTAFQDFGKVISAKVIRDKITGLSKGYGFVEMPDDGEAANVIDNVNGGTWEGNIITVKKAFNRR